MDNPRIIHAPMNGRRYTVTAPITQYDYGYLLLPEGVELPTTYEVDFSNDEHKGTSLTVYGGAEGAEVPEELIRTGKDVFAFYYKVGDNYGKTDFTWKIPNHCRPSRDGETPTPSQQSSIDQLIVRSNEAVESAEQSASDASTSAQNASADAERAEEARTDAQNYATQAEQARDDAQTYANNASASATSASQSATASANSASASAQSASQAEQTKTAVEDLADDAQTSANSSGISARASGEFASQAQGFARQAESYANGASGYASQAQSSAQTASTKASEASTSAQTASTKASESAQSATNASQSAQTAESAKVASQTAQGLSESARDDAIDAKTDAESARDEAHSIVDGISEKAEQIDANTASIASLTKDKAPVITDTASGSIASFADGADNLPLKCLVVDINPIQDLSHGDPSPENICPMSGWTQVNVNHSDADMTNPTTISIDLGQTVYGGKLDVLSGVLTVDSVKETYDGTEAWIIRNPSSTSKYFTHQVGAYGDVAENDIICDMFKQTPITGSTQTIGINVVNSTGYNASFVNLRPVGYMDMSVDDFKAWLAEHPITVVYGVTTPIEIQLDAHAINSLYGTNNIFADTGDVSVEYRADMKLYIEKLTQPEEDDMIADANITSGQYFMVGNSLYKATANIANGGQIIVGTNATRVSLAQALNEINA